jgi:hypothetical protein
MPDPWSGEEVGPVLNEGLSHEDVRERNSNLDSPVI